MERDLSLIRKRRAERDRINGVAKAPSPSMEDRETSQTGVNMPAESAIEGQSSMHIQAPVDDTLMAERPADANVDGPPIETRTAQMSKNAEGQEGVTALQAMPQGSENAAGLAITIPSESTVKGQDPQGVEKPPGDGLINLEASLQTPDTANLDFESMFNDTDLGVSNDAMNFDLGFSEDANLSQDILNDSTFDNINMSNTDMTNLPATTNEDINSLLPGLENYVNAGSDFSSIAVPATSTMPQQKPATLAGTTAISAATSIEPVLADTTFDDLFASGTFSMEGMGDDDMGNGTLGELEDFDEDWFNQA